MIIDNLSDILTHQVKQQPNKIAIFSNDKSYTYKELDILVSKLATYLHTKGVKQKDICLHYFKDEYLTLFAMLASAKIGATLVSLSTINHEKINELQMVIQSKYFLSDIILEDQDMIDSIIIKYEDFTTMKTYKNKYEIEPSFNWQIIIGSGTTGREKLFGVSQVLELQRIKIIQNSVKQSSDDIVASLVKLNFNSAKLYLLATLYSGGSYFIFDNKITNFAYTCSKNKISILHTTVFYIENILKTLEPSQKNILNFLKVLSIGSSTVSEDLKQKIKEYLTSNLYIFYGANEVSRISTTNTDTIFKIKQTVGTSNKDIELQIVDAQGKEETTGEIGHIRVKSPGMIKEYLRDTQNTKKSFKEGWFYPGDLGKFTQNKELIYCGRSDDMMIVNGINIYPASIEKRLIEHSDVIDSVCIPFNTTSKNIPVCAVVLKKYSNITSAQLLQFCSSKLGFSSPREIVILDKLPRSTLGKIQKIQLKENIYEKLLKYTRVFTIKLEKMSIADISLLDRWLEEVFNIKITSIDNINIYTVAQRAILIIEKLLQISQIPAFYKGEICSIDEDETSFILNLRLHYIKEIPLPHYINILNHTFKYIQIIIQNKPTLQNKEFIINKCIHEIINPILITMPQGSYRIEVLKEVFEKDIPSVHLGGGIYQLGWGSKGKKIDRSTTTRDSAMGLNISSNKIATAKLLRVAGLPTPEHGFTNTLEEAILIANNLTYPVVVKPLDLDRGEGVSVNIGDEKQLSIAFDKAYSLSPNKKVIIEKQVKGVCYRIFIAHGKLLYALKRLPIGIYADGLNTISTLIDKKNKEEQKKFFWEKKDTYFKDTMAIKILKLNNFTLHSIPKKQTFVALRDIETTQWGGIDEDVSDTIHKSNIDIAFRATKLLELNVAGVDIITEDITKPWHETNAIINEINYAPALGASKISKKHIPEYLNNYIEEDGRIPIEIFIGDKNKSLEKAKKSQSTYIKKGLKAYLVTSTKTYNDKHEEIFFSDNTLLSKCEALLLNTEVDVLIIIDTDNIFIKEYSPFDKVSKIVFS